MANGWKRIELLKDLGATIGNTLMQREKAYQQRLMGRQQQTLSGLESAQRLAYAERAKQIAAGMKGDELTVIPVGEARELDKRGIYEFGVKDVPPVSPFKLAPQPEWIERRFAPPVKVPSVVKHISDKGKGAGGKFDEIPNPWKVNFRHFEHLSTVFSGATGEGDVPDYHRDVLGPSADESSRTGLRDIEMVGGWWKPLERVRGNKVTYESAINYPKMLLYRDRMEAGVPMPKKSDGTLLVPERGLGFDAIVQMYDRWKTHFAGPHGADTNVVILVNHESRKAIKIDLTTATTQGISLSDLVRIKMAEGFKIVVDKRSPENRVGERDYWDIIKDGFSAFLNRFSTD